MNQALTVVALTVNVRALCGSAFRAELMCGLATAGVDAVDDSVMHGWPVEIK